MPDPFIVAHQRGPRFYSIGGKLFPISLRDQFLRGEMLVHRLAEAGLIGPARHPVVVVGAGAAGVAAAICAAVRHGCRVYLVEKTDKQFSLQATCTTRRADPTLYDYPALHWEEDWYPEDPAGRDAAWRVSWEPGAANQLAVLWRNQFEDARRAAGGRLRFVGGALAGGFRPDPSPAAGYVEVDVTYHTPGPTPHPDSPVKASAVIWAAGFGRERRYLRAARAAAGPPPPTHPTWGFEFWGDDPLADADYGLTGGADPPRVVISGSGDGALQDFLRVMTGCRHTREVYDRLFGPGLLALPPPAVRRLHDSADRASRVFGWGTGAGHDHGPVAALHATHVEIVDHLFAALRPRFETAVRAILRPTLPELKLIHSCDHFANGYPLNRLVVLVVKKYLDVTYGEGAFFMPGRQVVDIRPTAGSGHACAADPRACHGRMHDVIWADCPSCQARAAAPRTGDVVPANVLVLRHGVDTADLEEDPTPPLARQLLPYGPPG